MSRRHKAEKREIFPDPKYRDEVVSKFMNNLMVDGKKSVAEKIVYGAFDQIEGKLKTDPIKVFHDAIDNVCLLYTSPSPRDRQKSRMPSSA